jgi:peptide chain release factor
MDDPLWLQISSGSGPEECAHAAALTLREIIAAARETGFSITVVDTEPSRVQENIRSCLLAVEGENADNFVASWIGTVQWIWQSAYRPHHKRKNWFVAVTPVAPEPDKALFSADDVRFKTERSGGPGGQNVNKTETSVRATHIPSGKSVVCRSERSQLFNKKAALIRLAALLEAENTAKTATARSGLRHNHYELERGNPIRIFKDD